MKLSRYTTEEIEHELARRKYVSEIDNNPNLRKEFYKLLEAINFHKYLFDVPEIQNLLAQARVKSNLTNRSKITIRQNGSSWATVYNMTDFKSQNAIDNLKLIHFFVEKVGMSHTNAVKIIVNAKLLTKTGVIRSINNYPYRMSYKLSEEYLLQNLNPVLHEEHFSLMETFHDMEHYELVMDCEKE